MQVGQMRPRFNGGGSLMPETGTTEWWLKILVLVEIGAIWALRRYFKSAHGG